MLLNRFVNDKNSIHPLATIESALNQSAVQWLIECSEKSGLSVNLYLFAKVLEKKGYSKCNGCSV